MLFSDGTFLRSDITQLGLTDAIKDVKEVGRIDNILVGRGSIDEVISGCAWARQMKSPGAA